ncbi:MAG: efflux RND transporter periplasmic adaptor subunit [Desulfobacterales bacterium]
MKIFGRVVLTLLFLLIVAGALGFIKGLQFGRMTAHSESFVPPPQTVTVSEVNPGEWSSALRAVGSVEAVQGVVVTAELPGKVERILLIPGAQAEAGQLLLQQDVSVEQAQLRAAESEVVLARKNLERTESLSRQKLAPKADLDQRRAALDQALAQVDLIRATIAQKTIRAPFSGRLGIRQVNLGEVLTSGQPIASLQALDPIFVNFYLPQQDLAQLEAGLGVEVRSEALKGEAMTGTISAVNPDVDSNSRNIQVQATVANARERLRPGMYVTLEVLLPVKTSVLTIPATAVQYAPYSDSVFVVEPAGEGENSQEPSLVLRQQFVQLGEQRGDFVAVTQGLEAGQTIVSTGVFKLRNGQSVVVDNRLAPDFQLNPDPNDA